MVREENRRREWVVVTAVAVAIAFLVFSIWIVRFAERAVSAPGRMLDRALGTHETQVDLGAVVTRLRALNRLETATMRVMHVSTTSQSVGVIPDSLSGDSITFLAVGDVIAGIDLSTMTEQDFHRASDGSITVVLPASEVLVTRLDNRQSRVLKRDTGVFRRVDVGLESRARLYAEEEVRKEALRQGILRVADENSEKQLADFFHKAGFKSVRFEHRRPSRRG